MTVPGNLKDRLIARLTESASANPLSALTGLGLIFYVLLRIVHSRFYGALGITPEEVGLGYAQTIAQSVIGIGGLFLIGMVYAVTVGPILEVVGRLMMMSFLEIVRIIRLRRWRVLLGGVLLGSLVGAIWLTVLYISDGESGAPLETRDLILLMVFTILLGAGSLGARRVLGESPQPTWHALSPPPAVSLKKTWHIISRRGRAVPVTIMSLLVFEVIAVTASTDAARVKEGLEVHGILGSWSATHVKVAWPVGDKYERLKHSQETNCLLYVGQSNGIGIFYDATGKEGLAFRVPMGQLIFRSAENEGSCDEEGAPPPSFPPS